MGKCARRLVVALVALASLASCKDKAGGAAPAVEDKEAEAMVQGIWVDQDTEMATFKLKGDSVFYPDSTAQPSLFKIYGDTLVIGASQRFPIVKLAPHLLWYKNQNGDVVRLGKSDSEEDSLLFVQARPKPLPVITEVVKSDTVVVWRGERYHLYVAINPTRYKVTSTTYSTDAVGVEHVYYDNIIHLGVYKGGTALFSRDIKKQMYARYVPAQTLAQSVLSSMEFAKADERGFHFNATICMPDGASCYMLDTNVSHAGKLTMELLEY